MTMTLNPLLVATALFATSLLMLAGCATAEPTGVVPGECLSVPAPLTEVSAIAAVEGFADAVERRDQECANTLVTQWFLDSATYPEGVDMTNWLAEGTGGCRGAVNGLTDYPVNRSEQDGVVAGSKYERTFSCITHLPQELAKVPPDSPTGFIAGWTVDVNDRNLELVRVLFGVIEEEDLIKIDYLELDLQPKKGSPTTAN